jgi:hypothetical protein
MTPTTTPETGEFTADLARQIAALSRDMKEQLIVWLQEELDGGPFIGDIPKHSPDTPDDVKVAWKDEIARRIDEMQSGKVEAIDAQGSAARLLQKMRRKYAP